MVAVHHVGSDTGDGFESYGDGDDDGDGNDSCSDGNDCDCFASYDAVGEIDGGDSDDFDEGGNDGVNGSDGIGV